MKFFPTSRDVILGLSFGLSFPLLRKKESKRENAHLSSIQWLVFTLDNMRICLNIDICKYFNSPYFYLAKCFYNGFRYRRNNK
uniref:Uncharacterized protein n=1 Tax=Picea sitchensis TaxID=3332 RepID=A0A6B9XPF5_PICSI|nr:hypothetical protein Q903MT_gene3832 [Picea sitchensis]